MVDSTEENLIYLQWIWVSKSLVMQNLAVNWSQQGLNGAYITLELSEDYVHAYRQYDD